MKFEILQEELAKSLGTVSRMVANRPQLAVLSNVLIEAKSDKVSLQATDLELGVALDVSAKVIETGKVTVPAKTLQEFVGTLHSGKVEIVLDKDTLVVSSGQYKAQLQTISAEEFPALPDTNESVSVVRMTQEELSNAAQSVIFAAAKDTLRPVLTGILMEISKTNMNLVATDGFRLAKRKLKVASGVGEEMKLLVPLRALAEASRMGEGENVEILHVAKSNQVIFMFGTAKLVTQLIDGNYPDYGKILPKEFTGEATIQKDELLQAVKAIHIFARENSNMMRWKLEGKTLLVKAETPERGGADVQVEMNMEGEGGEVVFNTKFVMEFLASTPASVVKFGLGEHLNPCAFREDKMQDFLYVVMPINA